MEKTTSPIRASASFDRTKRLPGAREFTSVFDENNFRVSARYCVVLARYNQLCRARLGMVVSKKNVRAAVQRARIKRLCREHFRQNQQTLNGLDIVILIKAGMDALDNATVKKHLDQLITGLMKRKNEALSCT